MVADQGSTQKTLAVLFSSRKLTALEAALQTAPALRLVTTHDCYAAAADILISPQALLIADVTTIKRDEVGLLTMAQRLGVPVYVYGQTPSPLPELASLPEISPENAQAALAEAFTYDSASQPQMAAPESLEQANQVETQQQEEEAEAVADDSAAEPQTAAPESEEQANQVETPQQEEEAAEAFADNSAILPLVVIPESEEEVEAFAYGSATEPPVIATESLGHANGAVTPRQEEKAESAEPPAPSPAMNKPLEVLSPEEVAALLDGRI